MAGLGLVAAGAMGPVAHADVTSSPAQPFFADLVSAPDPGRYGSALVAGRLAVPVAGGVEPVAGARVLVFCTGMGAAEGTTDGQGRFRTAVTVGHPAKECEAVSEATAERASAKAALGKVRNVFEVRIVVDGGPPRVPPGGSATLTGHVQRREVGGWTDLPHGVDLQLYEKGSPIVNERHLGPMFHDGPGGFTLTLTSNGFGPLTAEFEGDHRHDPAVGVLVRGQWRTEIRAVRPLVKPEHPHFGRTFTVSSKLTHLRGPVPGARLELQTAPLDFRGPWKTIRKATTGKDGSVHITLPANRRQNLQFVFRGNAEYAPAPPMGYGIRVETTYQTKIVKFNASPEPVRKGGRITLRGRLMRWTAKTGWRPLKNKWISDAYRPKGAKRYRSGNCPNGGTVTDSQGWFRMECRARTDATWMAYYLWQHPEPHPTHLDFPAQAHDYVEVK